MRRILRLVFVLALVAAGGWYYVVQSRPVALVLTGIVTGHDVVIAPQIAGRLAALHAREGDTVTAGQLLAEIEPGELEADRDYYTHTAQGLASTVQEQEAALRYQRRQLQDQEAQAEAAIATTMASHAAAVADAERAKFTFDRTRDLAASGLAPAQQLDEARTSYAAAQARVDSLARQIDAQRAALSLVRANVEQVSMRRSQVQTSQAQLAAVGSQRTEGRRAPRVHAARRADRRHRRRAAGAAGRSGHVRPGRHDADQSRRLWVRADIEETYIDRVKHRRHVDRAAALGRGAHRARCSIAAPTPASRRSATSAAPSATSGRSKPACASTTPTAGSRSA